MSDTTIETTPALSIHAALIDEAWVGLSDPLTDLDVAAIAKTASEAAATIVEGQYDGFLPSPNLDSAWVAGWHAAIKHAAHHLRKQDW